jgi:hypothetical protein
MTKKLVRPKGIPRNADQWGEVLWSEWHHGQHVPEQPWCYIVRSDPGKVPGAPRDGIRYMSSYSTRERAVREVAQARVQYDRRVINARQKLAQIEAEALALLLLAVDEETPTHE